MIAAHELMKRHAPHSSGKQEVVLSLLAGVIGLELLRGGKLRNAWTAATSGAGVPAHFNETTGSAAGSLPTTAPGAGSGGGASKFGLITPEWQHPESAWLSADRGLVPDAAGEYNYATHGHSVPVSLPGSGTWQLEKQGQFADAQGPEGYEVWKNGPLTIAFLHLRTLFYGTAARAGQVVGMTGWPTQPSRGVGGLTGPANAHLAVVENAAAMQQIGF